MNNTSKSITDILTARIVDNCTPVDVQTVYDEMLDDIYSLESVGGPFAHMSASKVLKECDPIAYQCGLADWLDGETYVEVDGSYYEEGDCNSELTELADELSNELDGMEEAEDGDRMEPIRASIAALERHEWSH